ncbi:hypothetical protein V8F06_001621 [Rhypophila decipiens]
MSAPEKHEPSAMTVDLEAGCTPRSSIDSDKPLTDQEEAPATPDSQVDQYQPCCLLCSPNLAPAILIYLILALLVWLGHSPFERDVQFPDSTMACKWNLFVMTHSDRPSHRVNQQRFDLQCFSCASQASSSSNLEPSSGGRDAMNTRQSSSCVGSAGQ